MVYILLSIGAITNNGLLSCLSARWAGGLVERESTVLHSCITNTNGIIESAY